MPPGDTLVLRYGVVIADGAGDPERAAALAATAGAATARAPGCAMSAATSPVFPGATSVSALEVYGGRAPDGLAGGTPHLHTVSAEAYLVVVGPRAAADRRRRRASRSIRSTPARSSGSSPG